MEPTVRYVIKEFGWTKRWAVVGESSDPLQARQTAHDLRRQWPDVKFVVLKETRLVEEMPW